MTELQALKQDLGLIESQEAEQPALKIPEEIEDISATATMVDFSYDKETIVSVGRNAVYEELTDPGDWEQLKEELDMSKETMVSDNYQDDPSSWQVNSSFRHLPDPWS
jgi:type IV pilus assembly protein PilB